MSDCGATLVSFDLNTATARSREGKIVAGPGREHRSQVVISTAGSKVTKQAVGSNGPPTTAPTALISHASGAGCTLANPTCQQPCAGKWTVSLPFTGEGGGGGHQDVCPRTQNPGDAVRAYVQAGTHIPYVLWVLAASVEGEGLARTGLLHA
jgi:hypothetical protein